MPSQVIVVSPFIREEYGRALRAAGFEVFQHELEATTLSRAPVHAVEDGGTITVRAANIAPVRLSPSTSPDDLVQIVDLMAHAQDLARRIHASERASATGLVAGILAHDANNAIAFILAAANEIAHASGRADADLLTELSDACLRLAGILRRLHSLQHVGEPQPVRIQARVTELTRVLRTLAGRSRKLTVLVEDELPRVRMDPSDLERSLINLVANARDATDNDGEITVSVRLATLTTDEHGAPPGKWVVLSVADDGTGMDPATLAQATDPFFTTKPLDRGTGLGLVSVARAMEAAGGHLRISSERGKGTNVELWLPTM